jgi:hypothetical protein
MKPGYYLDNQGTMRWWTGQSWTAWVQPPPPPSPPVKHTPGWVIVLDVIGIMLLILIVPSILWSLLLG